jgi:hypothetical protein
VTLDDAEGAIAIIGIDGGVLLDVIAPPDETDAPSLAGWTHERTLAIDVRDIVPGEQAAVISQYTRDLDGANGWVITYYAFARRILDGPTLITDAVLLRDLAFFQDDQLLVTDNGANSIYEFTRPADVDPVSGLPEVTSEITGAIVLPSNIAISEEEGLGFVTVRNLTPERPDTVLSVDLDTLEVTDVTPVGLNPGRLVWNQVLQELFVVSSISRTLTRLPLSTLLPGNPDLF